MKLGKQVYRNKLNGELYRELISGNMPCGIRGVRFKVKLVNVHSEVYYFPNPPHKTMIKKMLDWIKRTYKIASLDISGV